MNDGREVKLLSPCPKKLKNCADMLKKLKVSKAIILQQNTVTYANTPTFSLTSLLFPTNCGFLQK